MSKFAAFKTKGKDLMKNTVEEGKPILFTTLGVVAGQKFLDFKTLFPNAKPDSMLIKHEGLIKAGGAAVALAMWGKNMSPMMRFLIMGVGIQGGIKAVRQYTMNDAGKAFVEQIGNTDYTSDINAAADKIIFAANTSDTSVAGPGGDTSKVLQTYSNTGVSGMGMNDDYNEAA